MPLSGFEDGAFFKFRSLPVWLEGQDLKDPDLVGRVQEFLRFHEQKIEYRRRKLSDGYTKFVYQLSEKPPAYCFYPHFAGIRQIAEELDMPCHLDRYYFLRYFHGGDFLKFKRRYSKKFRRYTVEALGIQSGVPEYDPFKKGMYPFLDPSQYKHPPFYWHEEPWCLIQVWRIRVFDCPLESIQVPLSSPLAPSLPTVLKFEWRWHPDHVPRPDIFERQQLQIFGRTKLQSFLRNCIRMTGGHMKRGRPKEYTDRNSFLQDCTDAYQLLEEHNGRPPNQSLLADELLIDRKTLRQCLIRFDVSLASLSANSSSRNFKS
jgi:hypothetical protein